jgi:hypothetical protein
MHLVHNLIAKNPEGVATVTEMNCLTKAMIVARAMILDMKNPDAAIIDPDPEIATADQYIAALNLNGFLEASMGRVTGRWKRVDLDMIRRALGRDPRNVREISQMLEHGALEAMLEEADARAAPPADEKEAAA